MTRSGIRLCAVAGLVAACGGALAAWHYHALGLTLTHYDARGHLVVARRIFDSLTPGWQQIGAVWLPLPHLLNAVPVQVDALYRTGASGVAMSVIAFGLMVAAVAGAVGVVSGARSAGVAAAAIVALNPSLLYLQSTPMTEPLLLALLTLGVVRLIDWISQSTNRPTGIGLTFALACLTRYEAWPVTGSALVLTAAVLWRRGLSWSTAFRRVALIAVPPVLAIIGFTVFSRIVIGHWFASGFFVPDNPDALGDPVVAFSQLVWGTLTLSGYILGVVATLGIVWVVVAFARRRPEGSGLIALSLFAGGALPWLAFLQGHPFRIRYMVPLIVAEAIAAGVVLGGITRRSRVAGMVAAIALVGAVAFERPPFDPTASMVVEAQWDRPNIEGRRTITACLRADYAGDTIMASMGSLGHYMQEASGGGFALRDFLHEGNGDLWLSALRGPLPFVGWILVEEKAEGGDMLATRARENPSFLDGFSRVCEASGVALYRRQNRTLNVVR